MSRTVICVDHVSKLYRLGVIGATTLRGDVQRWWARKRGQVDPLSKVGRPEAAVKDGELWALRDVSVDVAAGDVLGLIGRNGAGKSTLLKILSRVTAPTAGEVRIRGRVASLLEVGTGFHPELTGRENVFLNGAILGMTRAEVRRRFDEIVEFAGLAEFIDTPVKRYSSGMYVRLAFAVAAHLECEILLVDEVLAVGDAEFQKRCLGKMQSISSQDRTVIFVSHNLAALSGLCHRAILLEKGEKQAEGPVDEVIAAYAQQIGRARMFEQQPADQRSGTGKARIQSVRLGDATDPGRAPVQSGGVCVLEIAYAALQPIHNPVVYVGLYDSLWRRIALLDSAETANLPATMPAVGRVRCTIPKLPLPPGTYSLNVALKEGTENLDYIEGAVEFQVIHGDFYGTGALHPHARAILMGHRWEAVPCDTVSATDSEPASRMAGACAQPATDTTSRQ